MNVCRNYGMTCDLANENGYCIITGCIRREYKIFSEAIPKPNKNLVEVVRCKECKHGEYREEYSEYECHASGCGLVHAADFFCADAERKESE